MENPVRRFKLPLDPWHWPATPAPMVGRGSVPAIADRDGAKFALAVWRAVTTPIRLVTKGKFIRLAELRGFARWMCVKINCGEKGVVSRELKALSFAFRMWAVDDRFLYHGDLPRSFIKFLKGNASHVTARAQFARIGRSLPAGDSKVISVAIQRYRDIVHRDPQIDINYETADDLYLFAKDWVSTRRNLINYEPSWAPNENTASLNFSAAEGGRLAELIADAAEVIEPLLEFTPVNEGSDLLDEAVMETAIQKARSESFQPRVIAVAEAGYKARVLTKFPAFSLLPGDIIRRQLYPLLEDEEWIDMDRIPNEDKISQFIRYSIDHSPVCVSSDLSNATDYIPHIYAQALWRGILDAMDAPEWVAEYTNQMFGSLPLVYPDGKVLYSRRGIHMGTPLSFMTLCLLHKYAVDRSGMSSYPHVIRGDDLIGLFPRPDSYFVTMHELGFMINKNKTIISRKGGVFVERTFRFKTDIAPRRFQGRTLAAFLPDRYVITGIKEHLDVPVVGILNPPVEGSLLRSIGRCVDQLPPGLSRGQIARLNRVIYAVYGNNIATARKVGVPISTPIMLGGCGIPNRKGRLDIDASFRIRRSMALLNNRACAKAFSSCVAKIDNLPHTHFDELFLRYHEESQLSRSVFTYEPQSTAYYASAKRRYLMFRYLGSGSGRVASRGLRENASSYKPCSLRHWVRMFSSLKASIPRYAVGRRADVSKLLHYLRSYRSVYIPVTSPGLAILRSGTVSSEVAQQQNQRLTVALS